MPRDPWEEWVPGVLSKVQMKRLCEDGYLDGVEAPERAIDQSAVDLHLSDEGFRLVCGAVKPFGGRYLTQIRTAGLVEELAPEPDGTFILKRKTTYLFRAKERLKDLDESSIYGQATAKSSVGRMDILARLIVDGMDEYERFEGISSGDLFVEITPIAFNVRVKPGISLSQLRFFYGRPEDVELRGREVYRTCLPDQPQRDGFLRVDLSSVLIGSLEVAAFCAHEEQVPDDPLDLWTLPDPEKPKPWAYYRFLKADSNQRLELRPSAFYILRSRERIALPKGIAVYCRATDESIGEMRIHYAGFVHPLFGKREDGSGTPLIFEVRGHDVPVSLKQEEKLARLTFYRMSEDAQEEEDRSGYNTQTLQLSKFFGSWPDSLRLLADGRVSPTEVQS